MSEATPTAVAERITMTGAIDDVFVVRDHVMLLVLLFGNGLEGDIRLTGNTAEAVEIARGLVLGTGSCRRVEPRPDSPLYREGDECYVQAPSTLVFLDPRPEPGNHVMNAKAGGDR
jgi:hypothetical protein